MVKDHSYPAPRPALKLVASNPVPTNEYEANRAEWEERTFRRADHFNVVRFGTHNGSEIMQLKSFAEAVYVAFQNERSLVYAVASHTAEAFCVPREDWEKYARIWLERPAKQEH